MLRNKRTGCDLTVVCQANLSESEQIDSSVVELSNSEHDFNKYWIFENTDSIRGGKISWRSPVYIRNATVPGYLTSDLQLSSVPTTDFTVIMANVSEGCIEITSEILLM